MTNKAIIEFGFRRIWRILQISEGVIHRGRILHILRKPNSIIVNYYSFKIFSRFWLVKNTRIIHHNQVLFTKFGKHLRHIESMTIKVERIENYWTNDVKSAARRRLLNRWPRKPGDKVVLYLVSGKTKSVSETPLRRRKYFEWIIKQLLNSAFVGYEEFCRSRRVLSTSAFGLCG